VAQHPDRFVAMASVALQHPEQAAAQLEDGVKRLGLRGASIGGHVNGEDLSLPKYGVLARGTSPSRRRDGRKSDRLRDRRALQLAGHRGPGAGSTIS
jgi:Amidohydrolase